MKIFFTILMLTIVIFGKSKYCKDSIKAFNDTIRITNPHNSKADRSILAGVADMSLRTTLAVCSGELSKKEIARLKAKIPKDAQIHTLDIFNSKIYCQKISNISGGSYVIEKSCLEQELEAKNDLSRFTIPSRILKYCTKIGETVGGSYVIMKTCVEEETNAKNSL